MYANGNYRGIKYIEYIFFYFCFSTPGNAKLFFYYFFVYFLSKKYPYSKILKSIQ